MEATGFNPLTPQELADFFSYIKGVLEQRLETKDKKHVHRLKANAGYLVIDGANNKALLERIAGVCNRCIAQASLVIPQGKDTGVPVFQFSVVSKGDYTSGVQALFKFIKPFPFDDIVTALKTS